jgi:alpha-N-arabinofuranosidase
MAHYAQTVNVIGCIKTTKTKAFFSSTALPLMLYRAQFGTIPVEVTGNCKLVGLNIAAAWTEDRKALTIAAVNPHATGKVVTVELSGGRPNGKATVWSIAGDTPKAFNTVDQQRIAIEKQQDIEFDGTLSLAPYSVSLYRIPATTP